jgi:hypothetical protein
MRRLGAVVGEVDAVLGGLDDVRLLESRTIQGFNETVLSAIFDSLAHLNGHTQEVVYITRLQLGNGYKFAWLPSPDQGGSAAAETVSLRDATFVDMPAHPLKPATAAALPTSPRIPGAASPPGGVGTAPPVEAPGDYLRDLEQEFQDEQDEGKVI